jgi:putative spermidine/putrescine transport system permease protein
VSSVVISKRSSTWARAGKTWAPVVPFAAWVVVFLGIPAVAVIIGAFRKPGGGGFTMSNFNIATQGVYLTGFENSFKMALTTAIIPAIAGTFLAYAIHVSRGTLLRRVCVTASGVFANFGGVPLAFMFIATLGLTGIGTQWLNDLSINLYNHGFTLYSFEGVALVYMYFQIPLMVLVTLPAFEGLKSSWREAAENLGAHSWQYWRHVGVPVLMPAILGSTLLVFGFGLSAYATADALTAGTIALTPIQIGSFLNGNVLAGQENVGQALAVGLIIISAIAMTLYVVLQRRASKWLR